MVGAYDVAGAGVVCAGGTGRKGDGDVERTTRAELVPLALSLVDEELE
jgi:hypothetical protein